MGLVSLLFSFQGRIGRLQYWLGNIGLGVLGIFAFAVLGAQTKQAAFLGKADPAAMGALATTSMLMIPIWLLMSWSGYAIQVKRFHDRGRTGYLCLIPVVLMFFLLYTIVSKAAEGASAPALVAALMPPLGLFWLVGLWFFIDLGCLPGVDGPNKYGNPPGSAPSAPAAPVSPQAAPASASVTSTLFGAQTAIDRAIAERAQNPQPTIRSAPAPATAPATGQPSFGRRAPQ